MPSKSVVRVRLKRDGTRAETRFRISPKRTTPLKSTRASVQSTAGSRGVRISVSNAGYTTFRGSVRILATHSIRKFPLRFQSPRHRVPSGFKRTLPELNCSCISDRPVREILPFPFSIWRQRHMQLPKYCGICSPRPWTMSKVSVTPMTKSAKSSKFESCDWFCYVQHRL